MLETMKNNAKKATKKRIIIWAIVIVVLMFAPLLAPIQYLIGPKDLTGKTNLDYSKYEGKYVEFEIKYVLDYYMEQVSRNTKTGAETTTGYGYVVYNYEDDSCYAVYVSSSKKDTMKTLMTQGENALYGIEGTKSIKVKGTLKKLSGSELTYYNSSIKNLEKYIPGITNAAVAYYVDSESVNRVPTYLVWIIYVVCVVGLIVIAMSAVRLGTGAVEKEINNFIQTHPGVTEGQIDSDMRAAANISNFVWAGHRFTVWLEGVKIHILDNSKLVWAYYYRVTGRRTNVSQVLTFDVDKKRVAINISKESGEKLLGAYMQTQPQMVIGYKAEIEKQYKKDFNNFLNIAYNPWKNGDYSQAASYGETGSSITVELLEAGDRKIEVIKVVREVTGLGLEEAKDLVETAPSIIKSGVSEAEAGNIKAQLEEAGASVSLK